MKLKNKKTREIGELKPFIIDEKIAVWINNKSHPEYRYNSLAELNEEWEDAPEEPKEYWYIDADGKLLCEPSDDRCEFDNNCRGIGNYFGTEEEAEKAVEKLKAWKRLKDRGFRFYGYQFHDILSGVLNIKAEFENSSDTQIVKDLDLLFGGEE